MVRILNAFVHVSVLIGLFFLVRETFKLILVSPNRTEKNMRLLALCVGFLIFLGARALGLDVPDLIIASLSSMSSLKWAFVGFALPSGGGALAAWFLLRGFQKRETSDLFVRMTVMLSTFAIVLFSDVYAELAARASSPESHINVHLLPNLGFFLGLSLHILLRVPSTRVNIDRDWEDKL